jgi:hypothetical protein
MSNHLNASLKQNIDSPSKNNQNSSLSVLGQNLYNALNGNNVLEDYVKAIDENWDNDSILRSIGERIGIYIPEGEDSAVYLYLTLLKYLGENRNPKWTKEKIEMTPTEYAKRTKTENLSRDEFYPLYSNRLLDL